MLERVWGNQNVLKGNDNGSLVIKLIALTSRVGILSLAAMSNSIVGPYDSSVSLQTVRGFEESSTLRHCQFESYVSLSISVGACLMKSLTELVTITFNF
mmetsp:Transcript_3869/g.5202  ORF Transcript_3869/g.5202 Transcript_3869/m.5202 type:complete len:99 (-) Transcript_3869:1203-1499(-)